MNPNTPNSGSDVELKKNYDIVLDSLTYPVDLKSSITLPIPELPEKIEGERPGYSNKYRGGGKNQSKEGPDLL